MDPTFQLMWVMIYIEKSSGGRLALTGRLSDMGAPGLVKLKYFLPVSSVEPPHTERYPRLCGRTGAKRPLLPDLLFMEKSYLLNQVFAGSNQANRSRVPRPVSFTLSVTIQVVGATHSGMVVQSP